MYSRIVSLILLSVFLFGFISEVEAADDFKQPGQTEIDTTIKSSTSQHEWENQAPFDDCGEGAPCNGHCHFGQCLSVILVEIPYIVVAPPEIEMHSIYQLPPLVGGCGRPFRPPIV